MSIVVKLTPSDKQIYDAYVGIKNLYERTERSLENFFGNESIGVLFKKSYDAFVKKYDLRYVLNMQYKKEYKGIKELSNIEQDIIKYNQYIKEAKKISDDIEKFDIINKVDDWNEEMKECDLAYISRKLTVHEEYEKQSASQSIILKGNYEGKKCFLKVFTIDDTQDYYNSGLGYEQHIYRYIKKRSIENPYSINSHFIEIYDFFKIRKDAFYRFLATNNITIDEKKKRDIQLDLDYIYIIITKEYDHYAPYSLFLASITQNRNLSGEERSSIIINTLFDLFYGIYLMNTILRINHNDLHFGNIILEELDEPRDEEYLLDGIKFTRKVSYLLHIYDFDRGYLDNYVNITLNRNFIKEIGSGNIFNGMIDVYSVITSLYSIIKIINKFDFVPESISTSLLSFIREVFDNDLSYFEKQSEQNFISIYFCKNIPGPGCEKPTDNYDHYAISILKRIFMTYDINKNKIKHSYNFSNNFKDDKTREAEHLEKKIIENEIVADTVEKILKNRKLFNSIIIGPELITEDPNSVQARVKEILKQHAIKRQRRHHLDPLDIELTEEEYLDTIVDEMIRITPPDDAFISREYSDIIERYKKGIKEYGFKMIDKDNKHFLLASYIYNLNKYYREKGGGVDSDFGFDKYSQKIQTRYLKKQSGGRLIYNLYKYLSNKQQYTSLINNN